MVEDALDRWWQNEIDTYTECVRNRQWIEPGVFWDDYLKIVTDHSRVW